MKWKPPLVDLECFLCGTPFRAFRQDIISGHTKSCGCWNIKLYKKRCQETGQKWGPITGLWNKTHGLTKSRTYKTWLSMRARCANPKNDNYNRYGGRGIVVCERWKKFENFLADMGLRPRYKTIDRINNNGNYEASNCRWATAQEQRNNQ